MALLYDNFIKKIADSFEAALSSIEAVHNFEYGDEFEIAVCETIRKVLPLKFGICRGFVVNAAGDFAGDDILIYERFRFPTVRSLDQNDFSRLEKIPIEAVLAYIEAKHTLEIKGKGPNSLQKAAEQTAKVKTLCGQRKSVPAGQITPNVDLSHSIAPLEPPDGYPHIRNPMFTMIMARGIRLKNGSPLILEASETRTALNNERMGIIPPTDLVVAGLNNVIVPTVLRNGRRTILSPFLLENEGKLAEVSVNGLAYGVAIVTLLSALDFIELGHMPWNRILANSLSLEYV